MLEKDTVVAIGVVFTAFIGLLNLGYSFRHNRRASYVTSVTVTRVKWIGDVRDNLSRFISLIYQCAVAAPSSESEGDKIFQEIAHKRKLLRLQLAPKESAFDRAFEQEIETLY